MSCYTFLLPAYKGRFLDEMLNSIQRQTYQEFKAITSDDCSPDKLYDLCKPYLSDYRFSYRCNAKNMGSKSLVAHWNLLLDLCDTDYLILASDDDVYDKHFLECIDALIKKYPQVDVIRAGARIINEKNETIQEDFCSSEYESQVDFLYDFYNHGKVSCIANYVFKTSALRKIGGFVEKPLAWGSDELTVMRLSGNGVCNTQHVLFSFRKSGMNITTTVTPQVQSVKNQALMETIRFVEVFANKIITDGTILSENRRKGFLKSFEDKAITELRFEANYVSFHELKDIFSFISSKKYFEGTLDKIHFIWSWIKLWTIRNKRRSNQFTSSFPLTIKVK